MTAGGEAIREMVLRAVGASAEKVTPATLEKRIRREACAGRGAVRSAIRELVEAGELAYAYGFGRTCLEISYNRPVRVSDLVVLKPPGVSHTPRPGERVITLQPGAAFGTGSHPTTRLSLRGIEYLACRTGFPGASRPARVLDIGTGSGVLAIAAVRFGADSAVGLDIDPCAISEARENVRLNGLEERILIDDTPPECLETRFTLVTANLRYPTLRALCPTLLELTEAESWLLFSGIRRDEADGVIALYGEHHFKCQARECEKEWASVVLSRKSAVLRAPGTATP